MSKKTVLIMGISSFVGSNLAAFLRKHFRVVGTYHNTPVSIPGVLTMPCDVLVREEIQLVMYKTRPDVTIYCAGLSSITDCSEYPDHADALNTGGLFNVTEYCQRYKSQVCYISSCFVFGGENKEYVEIDIPDSNTTYGKTQASAEFFIQKTSLNYLIFRSCPLYGRALRPDWKNWFERMEQNFYVNKSFLMDSYVKTGFLDVTYLAMVVKLCIDHGATNRLFQLSSSDSISRYDFAKLYAKIYEKSADIIGKGKWNFPVHVTPGMSEINQEPTYHLDVSNAEGYLNIKMPTVEESLQYTYKRLFGNPKKDSSKTDAVKFI